MNINKQHTIIYLW